MTVTRTFIAWEEGWEKFNSIVQVMRSLLQGFLLSMKILMWYDPDSRKQMHSAQAGCTVLIKHDKNSERM